MLHINSQSHRWGFKQFEREKNRIPSSTESAHSYTEGNSD